MARTRFPGGYLYTVTAWIFSIISVVTCETCSYITYGYNYLDNRNEQMVTYKDCQWGCCWRYQDPCCSPPVALIVGSILGVLVCIVVVFILVCCCCLSKRRHGHQGVVVGYSGGRTREGTRPGVNVISSPHTTSQPPSVSSGPFSTSTTSLPMGGEFEPPPSYQEVMSGQYNYAFKSETHPQ